MDSFDYTDDALQPTRNGAAIILNILTVVIILITLCICVWMAAILINPWGVMNPYPPPTPNWTATITPTPKQRIAATWTPTASPVTTSTSTSTITPLPTATQANTDVPTQTPGDGQLTQTPGGDIPTPTPSGGMPFILKLGDPSAINNIWHPDEGCNYLGVGGQAFDLSGAPVEEGLFVQLRGTLDGELVEMITMVGMLDTIGPGIYEFILGEEPKDSTQTLYVQLFDQAMLPLSEEIFFDTYADCERNLILIHFDQVR